MYTLRLHLQEGLQVWRDFLYNFSLAHNVTLNSELEFDAFCHAIFTTLADLPVNAKKYMPEYV